MPAEKGKLGPRPSKRHLLTDGDGGEAGDGADTPSHPPSSHTSRVSFSSQIQVQQAQSPVPAGTSRRSRSQQSLGSRPSSSRLQRAQGSRTTLCSPVPSNAAARGQCRRLRSCVACSGKVTPDMSPAVTSAPPTPASADTEPLLVHQLTQTEPPQLSGAAERVDRDIQTESPAQARRNLRVRLFMDREMQTDPPALIPSVAPGAPEPPGRRQRLSLFRRLLRACRCTRAQPEQPGPSAGPKAAQQPQGLAAGIGVLMVFQESDEALEWPPCSWPWLLETSL